jgi:hypothetical protein
MLWGEYHVHRPHFTGRPSGLGVMGSCKVYQPFLQVPHGNYQVSQSFITHHSL